MGRIIKDKKDRETAKILKRLAEVSTEIRQINEAISLADKCFDEVENDDLTEALIYDRSALLARYSFLIKEAKRLESELALIKDLPKAGKNA